MPGNVALPDNAILRLRTSLHEPEEVECSPVFPYLVIPFPEERSMSEERECVVKLVDDHGVEHRVRVRAESVYEAALKGLTRLEKVGWESDGSQIGSLLV